MNRAVKAIIRFMVSKRYIGAKPFAEEKLIKSRTKWLSKEEFKEFKKDYKRIIHFFRRQKKRTGKGSSWHISIDPRCLNEIEKIIGDDDD